VQLLTASGSPASHELLGLPKPKNHLNAIFNCQVSILRCHEPQSLALTFTVYAITATAEPAEFDDGVSSLRELYAQTTTR